LGSITAANDYINKCVLPSFSFTTFGRKRCNSPEVSSAPPGWLPPKDEYSCWDLSSTDYRMVVLVLARFNDVGKRRGGELIAVVSDLT